jgi:serine/threonine protein phosphatase 1
MGNRTFVVGDIHGCSKTFNHLLDVVGLERTDELYLLGDFLDRGPDSKGVIETILRLQKDGFGVQPLRGNHEEMMLLTIRSGVFEDLLDWLENGGTQTLMSYGVDHPNDIPRGHLQFLEELPYYRMTGQYLFVHAGLDFSLDDPLSVAGRTEMLWTRDGVVNSRMIGGRTLVTGHSTQSLDAIKKSLSTKHILTDNGCFLGSEFSGKGKGNLIAANLDTSEVIVQPCIDGVDYDHLGDCNDSVGFCVLLRETSITILYLYATGCCTPVWDSWHYRRHGQSGCDPQRSTERSARSIGTLLKPCSLSTYGYRLS